MIPYLYRLKQDSMEGYYYIQYRPILIPFVWFYLDGTIRYDIESARQLLKELRKNGHFDKSIN